MIDDGSFRDPSGYVFRYNDNIYRGINTGYKENYEKLMGSGLYESLVSKHLLIPHEEDIIITEERHSHYYRIIKPVQIPFISYPYEWSFSQFRDAALATLEIQKTALDYGMILKDANGFNIQFFKGKPVLIDTLSFEIYQEQTPWIAYKQFCEHFVGPLALMYSRDPRLGIMMRNYINGIPLDLVVKLLPARLKLNPSVYMHLVLHSKLQKKYSGGLSEGGIKRKSLFTLTSLKRMATNLENMLLGWNLKKEKTQWGDYYQVGIENSEYLDNKETIIKSYLEEVKPSVCWDLGANDARFSEVVASGGANVIALDSDHACIERSYLKIKKEQKENILPLIMDLTNPSPGLGWFNTERASLFNKKNKPDLIIALALVHHLVISNNIPLGKIAKSLASVSKYLIIEFVPKSDSKVRFLLSNREDIFDDYTTEGFENCFNKHFDKIREDKIEGSDRILFLYKNQLKST